MAATASMQKGETYVVFESRGRQFTQYDFRKDDGELFSCVRRTVKECRAARDKWLAEREQGFQSREKKMRYARIKEAWESCSRTDGLTDKASHALRHLQAAWDNTPPGCTGDELEAAFLENLASAPCNEGATT